MKQGKTLIELATEIERQSQTKRDMVADTRKLELVPIFDTTGNRAVMEVKNGSVERFPIQPLAHKQIAERTGIPSKYYERMLANEPQLLATNVNTWFLKNPEKRMVRTLDGAMRSFNSDRYQRLDNFEVMSTALPILMNTKGIEVVSAEVTPSRMYIKWVNTSVTGEIKSKRVGDIVQAGGILGNSEVGLGSLFVSPFAHFLACLNGMKREGGYRRAHLGKQIEDSEQVHFLTDETKLAEDHAVLLKVRDFITAATDEASFRGWIDQMQGATTQKIEGDPVSAVEVLSQQFGFAKEEQSSVLRHLIEGADLSRYGLMNAVTRTAADLESYDRASEFEAAGGTILTLPASDWKRIAVAA